MCVRDTLSYCTSNFSFASCELVWVCHSAIKSDHHHHHRHRHHNKNINYRENYSNRQNSPSELLVTDIHGFKLAILNVRFFFCFPLTKLCNWQVKKTGEIKTQRLRERVRERMSTHSQKKNKVTTKNQEKKTSDFIFISATQTRTKKAYWMQQSNWIWKLFAH